MTRSTHCCIKLDVDQSLLHSAHDFSEVNMRLQPQVPSAQDAIRHFQDMAHGRLPKRKTRPGKLYGGWGGSGPSLLKTTLITPTAMAVEQAKSQLKRQGETLYTSKPKKERINKKKTDDGNNKKKQSTIKGRAQTKKSQSGKKPQGVKKYQDNFA